MSSCLTVTQITQQFKAADTQQQSEHHNHLTIVEYAYCIYQVELVIPVHFCTFQSPKLRAVHHRMNM